MYSSIYKHCIVVMMLLLLVLCTLTICSIVTIMTVVVVIVVNRMGRKLLYRIGKDIFEVCAGATVVTVHAHIL